MELSLSISKISRVDSTNRVESSEIVSVKGYQVLNTVDDHRRHELCVVDLGSAYGMVSNKPESLFECVEIVGQNSKMLSDQLNFLSSSLRSKTKPAARCNRACTNIPKLGYYLWGDVEIVVLGPQFLECIQYNRPQRAVFICDPDKAIGINEAGH